MSKEINLKIDELKTEITKLPTVKFVQSSVGDEFDNYFNFWVNCSSLYSMAVIARSLGSNYINCDNKWFVSLETKGNKSFPQFDLDIHMVKKPNDDDTISQDLTNIINNIKYWGKDSFKEYFGINKN